MPVPQYPEPIATPLRAFKTRVEPANLEQPNRRRHPVRHHAETNVLSKFTLPLRPDDETLEAVDGRWWRRNEPRDFLRCEHGEQ
jgi:hypothetical protein